MSPLCEFYVGLTRAFRSSALPRDEAELRFWFLVQPYRLWDRVCRIDGRTFGQYVADFPDLPLPLRLLRHRGAFLVVPYLWPAIALALAGRHGLDARRQWRLSLRRPDLYLAQPAKAFDERAVDEARSDIFDAIFASFDHARGRSSSYEIDDKRTFAERAARAGLPHVPSLSRQEAMREGGEFIVKAPRVDKGEGIRLVSGERDWADLAPDADVIIQRRLRNHPALLPILPPDPPLSTLRILTTLDAPTLEPRLTLSFLRVGVTRKIVDNLSAGGIMLEVDPDTGTLDVGIENAMAPRARVAVVSRAPGAKAPFAGTRVPGFEEAAALCHKAHRQLAPDVLCVGWDVALTEAGPMLVEANLYSGSFQQRHSFGAFHRTNQAILALLERHR